MQDKKNSKNSSPIRIATRKSKLAMAQANLVGDLISPVEAEFICLSTPGDKSLSKPLFEIGGKGVFVKTLEHALLSGKADCAVHSLKDMETQFASGTQIISVLPREDPRDAILGAKSLDELPINAKIGTASVRRKAQLLKYRPDLEIQLLRGNINRRIACLENKEYDAIILAVAGLKRLNIKISYNPIDIDKMPPAASQGTIAIQIFRQHPNHDRLQEIFSRLHCHNTGQCITAERSVLSYLDGSCRTPISAYAHIDQSHKLQLQAHIYSPNGDKSYSSFASDEPENAEKLGVKIAKDLLFKCGGTSFIAR